MKGIAGTIRSTGDQKVADARCGAIRTKDTQVKKSTRSTQIVMIAALCIVLVAFLVAVLMGGRSEAPSEGMILIR